MKEQEVNGNVQMTFEPKEINKVLFILFAEFLGYESMFVEWADKICEGEKIENFQRILVERDADYIFKKMQEEYTVEEIRGWYDEFYACILKEYDDKIKEMEKTLIHT